MSDGDRLRLLAYLDQESSLIREQWNDTDAETKMSIGNWMAMDLVNEPHIEVPKSWTQFATRCALAYVQGMLLENE